MKYGPGKCSGYVDRVVNEHSPPPPDSKFRKLLPRQAVQPLCRAPGQNLFETPEEHNYFQRFQIHTVSELTGVRDSELWTRIVLQAAQEDPCIRHAVVALAALDSKNFGSIESSDESFSRRRLAYSEYHRAIAGLRKELAAKNCKITTKLISCILFACFEAHHGNNDTVLRQIFAGIRMMGEYASLQKVSRQRLLPLNEDLVQVYSILEITASAMGDDRDAAIHLDRLLACKGAIDHMPTEFKTLKEASRIIYLFMRQGIHLRSSQTNTDNISLNETGPRFIGLSTTPAVSEVGTLLGTLRQWGDAFGPLWRKAQNTPETRLLKEATLLRMHWLGCIAWVASGTPGAYTRYTKELTEIVELSKTLLNDIVTAPFAFDLVLILPLSIVGWAYRHRALRREAISLFQKLAMTDRREAIWDAGMIGKTMEWLADIEEGGLRDEEYVPEDVMANITSMKVDGVRKSVLVGCNQGVIGYPGMRVYKEKIIYWGRETAQTGEVVDAVPIGCRGMDEDVDPINSQNQTSRSGDKTLLQWVKESS